MVGIGQAVDIGKVTVGEPDFLGFLVHLIDKGLLAAGQPFGQHDAGVVARLHDHAAHQILDLDAAAERHEHLRSAGPPGVLADRQLVIELSPPLLQIVEDEISGHHLAHRRRRHALLGVLVEQNRTGIRLHHKGMGRLCVDWAGGRFRHGVLRGIGGAAEPERPRRSPGRARQLSDATSLMPCVVALPHRRFSRQRCARRENRCRLPCCASGPLPLRSSPVRALPCRALCRPPGSARSRRSPARRSESEPVAHSQGQRTRQPEHRSGPSLSPAPQWRSADGTSRRGPC